MMKLSMSAIPRSCYRFLLTKDLQRYMQHIGFVRLIMSLAFQAKSRAFSPASRDFFSGCLRPWHHPTISIEHIEDEVLTYAKLYL